MSKYKVTRIAVGNYGGTIHRSAIYRNLFRAIGGAYRAWQNGYCVRIDKVRSRN